MPVKILLADKSITIQKVVEMLFSGKEYEVVCVSDGDTALAAQAAQRNSKSLRNVPEGRMTEESLAFNTTARPSWSPVVT